MLVPRLVDALVGQVGDRGDERSDPPLRTLAVLGVLNSLGGVVERTDELEAVSGVAVDQHEAGSLDQPPIYCVSHGYQLEW